MLRMQASWITAVSASAARASLGVATAMRTSDRRRNANNEVFRRLGTSAYFALASTQPMSSAA
jgi:hypothetical protein